MRVPFLDLRAQYESIKPEINAAIQEVLDSCAFAGGPFVEKFEKEWAAYCGVKHAIGVGNGTDALWLALLALGVGRGDEVVTVSSTFMATAEAISLTGATPVFVDIDERYYTMDPNLLEKAITSRTKAIIPVHLFGQCADMDPILDIARRRGIPVIEDACQAHGAEYHGKKAGSMGEAAAFSFYPSKNLGAFGEAGAVTTNRDDLANRIWILRDHGQSKKYHHEVVGLNARMDGIQSAILSVKLTHLDDWNSRRSRWATYYNKLLADARDIIMPAVRPEGKHIYHVYAIRVKERDRIISIIKKEGIDCGIHYPIPVHKQNALKSFHGGILTTTETCAKEFLSLPMYSELNADQVRHVCEVLRSASLC